MGEHGDGRHNPETGCVELRSRIKLGDLVTDVTGYTGYVTARTEYLNDPFASLRVSRSSDDGSYIREEWIGESRLKLSKPAEKTAAVVLDMKRP